MRSTLDIVLGASARQPLAVTGVRMQRSVPSRPAANTSATPTSAKYANQAMVAILRNMLKRTNPTTHTGPALASKAGLRGSQAKVSPRPTRTAAASLGQISLVDEASPA